MYGAGWNMDGISNFYVEFIVTQKHSALSGGDVINLFRLIMTMGQGGGAGVQGGFGQTLIAVAVCRGMHEFADYGLILGGKGGYVTVGRLHGRRHFFYFRVLSCQFR